MGRFGLGGPIDERQGQFAPDDAIASRFSRRLFEDIGALRRQAMSPPFCAAHSKRVSDERTFLKSLRNIRLTPLPCSEICCQTSATIFR